MSIHNKIDEKELLDKLQKIKRIEDEDSTVTVMVDVFWPHPMTVESQFLEHKCHKVEMMTFPSLLFVSNNESLTKYFTDKFIDPYTKKSQVAKISVLYNEWLYPEKIIVVLNSPLRQETLTSDMIKKEVEREK